MSDAFTKMVQAGDYTKLVADALQHREQKLRELIAKWRFDSSHHLDHATVHPGAMEKEHADELEAALAESEPEQGFKLDEGCTCTNNPKNSWPNLPHDSTCPLAAMAKPATEKQAPASIPVVNQAGPEQAHDSLPDWKAGFDAGKVVGRNDAYKEMRGTRITQEQVADALGQAVTEKQDPGASR